MQEDVQEGMHLAIYLATYSYSYWCILQQIQLHWLCRQGPQMTIPARWIAIHKVLPSTLRFAQ